LDILHNYFDSAIKLLYNKIIRGKNSFVTNLARYRFKNIFVINRQNNYVEA